MKLFNYFKIGVFLPLFILISIILGIEKRILFLYFLGLIHELLHVLTSLIFRCKLNSFSLSVFGFSADIDNVDYLDFSKQILIYIAGPFSYFLSTFIIYFLFKNELINEYYYRVYNEYNLTFNLFNLLPIYPLDGGRILDAVYRKVMPIKKTFKIRKIWGIIGIIPLIVSLIYTHQIILSFFFFLVIVLDIKNINKEYYIYLQKRLIENNDFPVKISNENDIYHFNNNLILDGDEVYTEQDFILKNIARYNVKQ